jgi:hypothetical protein
MQLFQPSVSSNHELVQNPAVDENYTANEHSFLSTTWLSANDKGETQEKVISEFKGTSD